MDFLRTLAELRTPVGDTIFQFITYFGQSTLILGVLCALYWCLNKSLAIQIGFTYFASGLCVQTLKIAARVPRPWMLDPSFQPVQSAVAEATGYSFPSGHTMGATSLYMPLALAAKKFSYKVLCVLLFLLVGFSRMYLGVHTPKDVLTAMMISVIFSLIFWKWSDTFASPSSSERMMIVVVLIVLSLLSGFYAWHSTYVGMIHPDLSADTIKSAGAGMGFALGWYLESKFLRFSTETRSRFIGMVRFLIGFLVTILLYVGLKAFCPPIWLFGGIRYFILVFWIIFLYPVLFVKFSRKA